MIIRMIKSRNGKTYTTCAKDECERSPQAIYLVFGFEVPACDEHRAEARDMAAKVGQ